MLTDRGWRLEVFTSFRIQLETAELRVTSSYKEQECAATELTGLLHLLVDVSTEQEQLQQLGRSLEDVEQLRQLQTQQQTQQQPDLAQEHTSRQSF